VYVSGPSPLHIVVNVNCSDRLMGIVWKIAWLGWLMLSKY